MATEKDAKGYDVRVTIRLVIPKVSTVDVWKIQDLVKEIAETYRAMTYEVILSPPAPELPRR